MVVRRALTRLASDEKETLDYDDNLTSYYLNCNLKLLLLLLLLLPCCDPGWIGPLVDPTGAPMSSAEVEEVRAKLKEAGQGHLLQVSLDSSAWSVA